MTNTNTSANTRYLIDCQGCDAGDLESTLGAGPLVCMTQDEALAEAANTNGLAVYGRDGDQTPIDQGWRAIVVEAVDAIDASRISEHYREMYEASVAAGRSVNCRLASC